MTYSSQCNAVLIRWYHPFAIPAGTGSLMTFPLQHQCFHCFPVALKLFNTYLIYIYNSIIKDIWIGDGARTEITSKIPWILIRLFQDTSWNFSVPDISKCYFENVQQIMWAISEVSREQRNRKWKMFEHVLDGPSQTGKRKGEEWVRL